MRLRDFSLKNVNFVTFSKKIAIKIIHLINFSLGKDRLVKTDLRTRMSDKEFALRLFIIQCNSISLEK